MEKRKTFHGRQVGKKRLLPIVFPLFLFLLIPLNGYGDDTPMPEVVQQNSTRITGVVKDAYGEPVIGANVKVVGTTQGTITDFEGKFSINVSGASAKIKISFIGYKDKEVTAKKGVSLNIVLEEDAQTLGEVQVVAYGVQKKVSITGAISSMKGDDLLKTPAGSLSNVLSGQITGISSVQYSGEPGADAADIYVRGVATWNNAKPLIQVDGVERDFSQIDPNEIESVTVLKDASATAVFGVRGANGVILITTKRGAEGKAKVSFSTSAGVNVRTKDLEFANSYQYASYYNMMKVNDGGVATFSDEQLETFRNHSNPLMYPDINWIDYCMNKAAFQSQHNVNISGGTSNMKYFVSAGLFTQGGMFKQFNATDDFNFDYKRYNYRANLDFDVTKTTLLSVNIGGRIETKRTPESGEDQNQLFRKLYWAVPFAGAGIVNGERVVSNSEVLPFTGVDGLSSYYGKGFQTKTTNVLNVDLALNQKLDFITKGLSVKLKGAYNSEYANTKKASSSKAYYTPVANADGSISLRKYGTDSQLSYGEPDNGFSKARNWYMELALNYARKFGDHNVTALLLYNQSKKYYPSEYSDIPTGYVGLVGRVTYDWKTRYMAEFNAGYNGSENFRPGNRYGFFPAGSLGWVVSEESFFQPIKSVVNYLKLRASVGMVGNDVSQRFLYLPDSYQYGDGGYYFGQNVGNKMPGASEVSRSNPDAKWETAVKQNYGVDATFLAERLTVSLDYFREDRSDILSKPDYLPAILGMSLPSVNVGETLNRGFEVQLKWNETLKNDFRYWANFNISFSRNKIVYKNEVDQNEPWMYETGRRNGINSKTNTLMLLFNVTYVESAEDEKGPEYVPDPNDAPETTEEGLVLKFHDEFNGTGEPDWNVWRWEEGFQRNQELQWYQKENAICKDGALIITGKEERVKNTNYEAGSSDWKKNREYAEYTSSCLITKDYRFRKGRMLVRAKIPTAMGAWPAIWTTGGSTDSWCWEWPLGGEIDLLEYYLVNGKPSVHANVCWGSDTRWNGKWQSYNRPVAEFIAKDKDWGKKYHIWRMDWCLDEDENTLRLYLDDELMNEIKDLKATTGNGSGGLDDWWRGSYRNPYLDEGNNAGKENDEGFGQCIWLNLALGSNGGEPDLSKFPLEYHVDYVRVYQFE